MVDSSVILIVEDDSRMADTLQSMVELLGYDTMIVGSSQAALTTVQKTKPGLLLLDLNLPDFDGFELCTRLKADPSVQQTPVIFVSAEGNPQVLQRAEEIGAACYLVKPVGLDDLERAIAGAIREQVD